MTKPRFPENLRHLKPRGELIADAIRTSILQGYFRPGDRLDQQEIADELAVSRIPVREALRTLDAEGLITMIPNKGAIVTERTITELSELYFIRGLLEGAAAERAAGHMNDERLARMAAIVEEADQVNELERLLSLNNEFHMVLYKAIPQPATVDLIQKLRNKVAPYNRLFLDLAGVNKAAAWADHQRILAACRGRDGARARAETERHLDRVLRAIVREMANA